MKNSFLMIAVFLLTTSCLLAQNNINSNTNERITYLTGNISNGIMPDTLLLVINGPFYLPNVNPETYSTQVLTTTANKEGQFTFKIITGNSPYHISLFLSNKRVENGSLIGYGDIAHYLIVPGDSINVNFNNGQKSFTGRDAALFEVQNQLGLSGGNATGENDDNDLLNKDAKRWLEQKDSLLNMQLGILADYKSRILPAAYSIVRSDVIGSNRDFVYTDIWFTKTFLGSGVQTIDTNLAELCKELQKRPNYIDTSDRAALSPKYIQYLYQKLKIEVKYERIINGTNVYGDTNYFPKISKEYSGVLRDKLLAKWITDVTSFNNVKPEDLSRALSVIKTPAFREPVEKINTAFIKGQSLIDFDFKDAKGKNVRLTDFEGKVLIIDVWFTGCSACIAVAKGLPNVEKVFKDRTDVKFISISIDRDKNKWLKSITANYPGQYYTHYTTPTTEYLYTSGTGDKNIFIEKYVPGNGYPSMLIVDRKSKVYSFTPPHPVNEEYQKKLIAEINEAILSK